MACLSQASGRQPVFPWVATERCFLFAALPGNHLRLLIWRNPTNALHLPFYVRCRSRFSRSGSTARAALRRDQCSGTLQVESTQPTAWGWGGQERIDYQPIFGLYVRFS